MTLDNGAPTGSSLTIKRQLTEHRGRFYLSRAFFTIFGGLLGWTLWALLPVIAFLLLASMGGISGILGGDDPTTEPTSISEPAGEPMPDPTSEPSNSCGPGKEWYEC